MDSNIKALPSADDGRVTNTRNMLLGLSTMGFVGCVVIAMKPRNEGFVTAGSSDLDALRVIGALAMALDNAIAMLKSTQPAGGGPQVYDPRADAERARVEEAARARATGTAEEAVSGAGLDAGIPATADEPLGGAA